MEFVTTEEIENLPSRPEVLLVDVRDPPEIKSTGSIPTSINIPCKHLERFIFIFLFQNMLCVPTHSIYLIIILISLTIDNK